MKIHANAKRESRWWLVHVPEVDRWTQARSLADVATMAADMAALMTGIESADVEVMVTIELPESVQDHLAEAQRLRGEAARANHAAAAASREAARELKRDGLTVRDIGRALDVSYQRAHQLISM